MTEFEKLLKEFEALGIPIMKFEELVLDCEELLIRQIELAKSPAREPPND